MSNLNKTIRPWASSEDAGGSFLIYYLKISLIRYNGTMIMPTRLLATAIALAACFFSARAALGAASTTLVPISTPSAAVVAPADPNHFVFAVGGDNRPPGHGDPMPPSLNEICREIGWIRPSFVIWTGDSIYGYMDTPAEASAEYNSFLSSAALCGVPVFSVPGNHEIGAANLAPVYQAKMGALYGSFDYGNSHFIGLDTTPVVGGEVEEGDLDDTQWKWLEADLAAHSGKSANIFVFFHHYMFGLPDPDTPNGPDTGLKDTATRDRLHHLFVKYGVRAVFNGHAHLYYHTAKDGIDYYIAGNAGAPMDAPPENGGFLGYMMVQVDGSKIAATAIPAWDLNVRPLAGRAPDGSVSVAVDDAMFSDLDLRGITIQVPVGSYSVSATAANKAGKAKQVDASILSTTPSPDGKTEIVTIEAHVPHARTTILTLTPSSGAASGG